MRDANIVYHDCVASEYEKDTILSGSLDAYNQTRIDEIIKNFSQSHGKSNFLDIGCGPGNILKFGQKYFAQSIGVYGSINTLKIALSRGMQVIQADTQLLPFESEKFEYISLFSVLHHIYDYSPVITQIGRVLNEGGIFYSDWDPQWKPIKEIKESNFGKAKYYSMEMIPNILINSRKKNSCPIMVELIFDKDIRILLRVINWQNTMSRNLLMIEVSRQTI